MPVKRPVPNRTGQPGARGCPERPVQHEPGCILQDATVFIGLASLPSLFQARSFDKELHKFFANYRKDLLGHQRLGADQASRELQQSFYLPATYTLLAPFDVAAIALTDDYDLGALAFHPLDPNWPEDGDAAQRGFYHQSIMGPMPSFPRVLGPDGRAVPPSDDPRSSAVRIADGTFLAPQPLPLVGVCQLKLQNALLIGAGTDILRCVVKATKRHFDFAYRDGRDHLRSDCIMDQMALIIIESYSWHEITLLVFGQSFEDIMRFVVDIREMSVERMREILEAEHEDGEAARILDAKDLEIFDKAQTLTRMYCGKTDKACLEASHVFCNSTTSLGVRSELCLGKPDVAQGLLARVCDKDEVFWVRRWNTRAGHLGDALRCLLGTWDPVKQRTITVEPSLRSDGFRICAGRGDFLWPLATDADATGSSRKLANDFARIFAPGGALDKGHRHVFSFQTTVGTTYQRIWPVDKQRGETVLPRVAARHPWISDVLRELLPLKSVGLTSARIRDEVLKPLKQTRTPQVVTERLMNACALLAEGLEDQFLVSNMIELLPYMQAVRKRIGGDELLRAAQADLTSQLRDTQGLLDLARRAVQAGVTPRLEAAFGPGSDETSQDVAGYLNSLADMFEWAWHNRFRVGWRLGEVSDFNLEYKGGIQQLTSALDGAYKALSWGVAGTDHVITIVTSAPDIVSNVDSVRLSFLDIYRPEFFAARAVHEAAEQILAKRATSQLAERLQNDYAAIASYTLADPAGKGPAVLGHEVVVDFVNSVRKRQQAPAMGWPRFEEMCLRLIRPRFIENLFADICNYRTTYLDDARLYAYWLKNCFIVSSAGWLRGGTTVNLDELKNAILRLALVAYPGRGGSPVTAAELAALIELVGPMWAELSTPECDCAQFLGEAMSFARLIHDYGGGLRVWLLTARKWTQAELLSDAELAIVDETASSALLMFEQGRVPRAPCGEPDLAPDAIEQLRRARYHHVLAVSHAFLLLLMKSATEGGRENSLLRRAPDGRVKDDVGLKRADSYLMFDSRGRTYSWSPAYRRLYLRCRSAYVMSLRDLSAKAKVWIPELAAAVEIAKARARVRKA